MEIIINLNIDSTKNRNLLSAQEKGHMSRDM